MRTCRVCERRKPDSEFYSGRTECKTRAKAQIKTFRDTNRDRINAREREIHNSPDRKAKRRANYADNKAKFAAKRFGTTEDHIMSLPQFCEICSSTEDLHVDHDHVTGMIRGTLCRRCNMGIGYFDEDLDKIMGMYYYILSHQDQAKEA